MAFMYDLADDLTQRSAVLSHHSCDSYGTKPRAGIIKLAPINGPVSNVKCLINSNSHKNSINSGSLT